MDRLVIDRAQKMVGRLRGTATFTPSGPHLLYEEAGTLIFGEHRGRAEQTYCYEFPDGRVRALVRFRDGRPFHHLDLGTGRDHPRHACSPDLYEGDFLALGPAAWRTEWKVTGPLKDYDLVTTYCRQDATANSAT